MGFNGLKWAFTVRQLMHLLIGMAMMQYTDVGKDFTYFDTIGSALANASFGPSASFLGDPALQQFSAATGKWNDDILWWALAGEFLVF